MEAAVQGKAEIGNLQLASLLLTAPHKAFAALDERPRFWFPLLTLLLSTVAILFWYYSIVDFEWLKEQMLNANERTRQMSDAERSRALAAMSKPVIAWSSVIAGGVAVVLLHTLEAAYFLLAGNLTNVQRSYRQWFAFSWWTSLPHIIGLIPSALLLLLSGTNQISSGELQPLSLNELFFHREMGDPGFALLSNLTLLHLVVWWITVLGVRTWSARSWTFSTLFGLLPAIICYGGWAVFVFSRS